MSHHDFDTDSDVRVKPRDEVQTPRRYKVLLHNDHYTSMEFVIMILETVFRRSTAESVEIMFSVHHKGIGVAGVYPAAVAETKIEQVHKKAEEEGFPLRCSMEPE